MKTLENITLTRVYSAVMPEHRAGSRHHIERRTSYAISFSLGGRIEYKHGGDVTVSDEGAVIIHPMGESYDFICTRAGAFGVINFYTTHFFTDKFLKIEIDSSALTSKFAEIKELIGHGGARPRVMCLMYEIIELLADAQNGGGGSLFRFAVREIKNRFTKADFTVAELASSVHISESYLRKLFAEETGISPRKYLIRMRITKAKQLLAEGTKSVSKIAEECGFSGVFHFCRAFRESVGKTPTEYRNDSKAKRWQM